MKIACLSGKGGAGKTLTAVNLAAAAEKAVYIDCDVEEPNGRLFFRPDHVETETVCSLLPEFDAGACTGCRECVQFCRFHALMYVKDKPMVFSEVCHSCGGCSLVCPEKAITEKKKPIGILETGDSQTVRVVTGILNPGEASGVPMIREALKKAEGLSHHRLPAGKRLQRHGKRHGRRFLYPGGRAHSLWLPQFPDGLPARLPAGEKMRRGHQ